MAGKNTAAFGIYRNRLELERGVDELRAADFRNEDISVLFPDNEGSKEFAHEKNTKAPEGATAGATTGAAGWRRLGLVGRNRSASQFPGSVHLSPPVPSWPRWPEPARGARSEA